MCFVLRDVKYLFNEVIGTVYKYICNTIIVFTPTYLRNFGPSSGGTFYSYQARV